MHLSSNCACIICVNTHYCAFDPVRVCVYMITYERCPFGHCSALPALSRTYKCYQYRISILYILNEGSLFDYSHEVILLSQFILPLTLPLTHTLPLIVSLTTYLSSPTLTSSTAPYHLSCDSRRSRRPPIIG